MKSRLKQQIFAISLLACTAISPANALQTHLLREQFQNPSDEAKPWTFWYWMFGAVSKEGITADLEAMKHAGLGGTYCQLLWLGHGGEPERAGGYGADHGRHAHELCGAVPVYHEVERRIP